MKKRNSILFFLMIQVFGLGAQDFTVSPNPAFVDGEPNGFPLIAFAQLVNDTYEPQTVVWKRTVTDLTAGWTSNVCTSQGCALEDVNEGTFTIIPLEGLFVDIQFNTNWIAGAGMVELELYFESEPDSIMTVVYHGSALATGVEKKETLEIEIYPNPAGNFFSIKGVEKVRQIKIFNILGSHLMTVDEPSEKIYVDHLSTGIYQIVFLNEDGRALKTESLSVF